MIPRLWGRVCGCNEDGHSDQDDQGVHDDWCKVVLQLPYSLATSYLSAHQKKATSCWATPSDTGCDLGGDLYDGSHGPVFGVVPVYYDSVEYYTNEYLSNSMVLLSIIVMSIFLCDAVGYHNNEVLSNSMMLLNIINMSICQTL